MQLQEFGEYCQRRRWVLVNEYVDIGISGAKEKQPEVIASLRTPIVAALTLWPSGNLTVSAFGFAPIRALETFQTLGIEFISLSEQLDTSTPTGKMIFTVLGAVAELERSLIAERVKAGLRNARAKGKRLGRPE